ncbi:putative LRR receptor-like serine/threonine-protein kinaseRLK-Pelle-LRR-I-1 family [Arabidopsis thaliana]
MEDRHRYLFFIFAIIHYVQAQQGFISLDCGLPSNEPPYIEPVTGLVFSSDADHIPSGISGRIQKNLEAVHIKPYLFLRYFPDGLRNCYTLDVLQNRRYMIKAVFVYGNYDGYNDYPSFDLYLGPNKWVRVDLEGKVNGSVEEIIHIPSSNSLQICLVKTGNSLPFISALELRLLRNDTYVVQDVSLKHLFRRYYRQSDRLIRYPDDVYDRVWSPFFLPEWTQITTSLDVNNSNNYEPPKAALTSAATPGDNGTRLTIIWTLDNPDEQIHLYVHFAELEPVGENTDEALRTLFTRTFYFVVNGKISYDESITPLDLAVSTVETVVNKCDGGNCSLQLVRSEASPGVRVPLVNAMEAFTAIKFPHSETNPDDVISIKVIQATYELSRVDWQGDPCLPQQFLWTGLNCSYMNMSTSPRIISLDLSSHKLTGKIVPDIQNLTQLQKLDLSNNKLTGGVPEFLANMKSLLFINLSNNNLVGSIPQALLDRKNLKLEFEGNPKLCATGPCNSSSGNKETTVIAPVAAAIAIFIAVLVLIIVFIKKRPSSIRALHPSRANLSLENKKRRITYSEILLMTNNFERVIGEGGFGVVYHGYLNDSEQVAVKVLSPSSSQGYKEFKAEVELLLRVHHINLVSLVGYCDEQAHLALIYEYMANGDLKSHLSGRHE